MTLLPELPARRDDRLRLGFAAVWERPFRATWSNIPWHLREALRLPADVVDVGIELDGPRLAALKATHLRHLRGSYRSRYRYSRALAALAGRTFSRRALQTACDAVLEILPEAAVGGLPYFVYHDASIDALAPHHDDAPHGYPFLARFSPAEVERLRARQRDVYARAAGVFAMSNWFARSLVADSGLPADRVHVVHPGVNALDAAVSSAPRPPCDRPRRRLLFVGKAFFPKGGDVVLGALEILRRDYHPDTTLTIVGPLAWSIGEIPPGVRFLGRIPVEQVTELYLTHDLFVMPSRIEPFGIVFVEALAHGLPCIGRRAFEMPVVIRPGENGALLEGDDPHDLAALIVDCLGNDDLYERCERARAEVVAYYSWERAAEQMLAVMRQTLASAS